MWRRMSPSLTFRPCSSRVDVRGEGATTPMSDEQMCFRDSLARAPCPNQNIMLHLLLMRTLVFRSLYCRKALLSARINSFPLGRPCVLVCSSAIHLMQLGELHVSGLVWRKSRGVQTPPCKRAVMPTHPVLSLITSDNLRGRIVVDTLRATACASMSACSLHAPSTLLIANSAALCVRNRDSPSVCT